MTIDQINFEPLSTYNHTFGQSVKNIFKNLVDTTIFTGMCMLVVVGAVINIHSVPVLLGMLGLTVLVLGAFEQQKLVKVMWLNFASLNGMQITPDAANIPYCLKGEESINCSPIVETTINDEMWHIFACDCSGSDGNSSSIDYYTIIHVRLDKKLPYIAIDSKKKFQGVNRFPQGVEKVNLEGDFNQYFSVYSQPQAAIDVLSIITPDVMRTLIGSRIFLAVS